jgi:hypothetical protein
MRDIGEDTDDGRQIDSNVIQLFELQVQMAEAHRERRHAQVFADQDPTTIESARADAAEAIIG